MMTASSAPLLRPQELSRIVKLVRQQSGICLNEGKHSLVTARLQKRLKVLGCESFAEYASVLDNDASGDEVVALLDAIATNHTSFFREPEHFCFLAERVVPELLERRPGASIAGWSAGCSTGEEPYSLAITLLEQMHDAEAQRLRLFASDISTRALATAAAGVYRLERLAEVKREYLRRYFERGLGAQDGLARVSARVRRLVEFRRLNLVGMGPATRWFELIFCRNVMIYFDRETRQQVVTMLEQRLVPGGYLFVSHAESLNGLQHGLEWVGPAIYRRKD
jgi:chemotaxis protein methyltransferase CheR